MNKQFIIKMMKAKQLQYEALKEIMPEKMACRLAKVEQELIEFGKEYVMSTMCDKTTTSHSESGNTKSKSRAHKVTIE